MNNFDIRQSEYLSGKINKKTCINLERKLKEFIEVTSSQKQGRMPTRAKYENIIAKDGEISFLEHKIKIICTNF